MNRNGPIILIDDDHDDCDLIQLVIEEISPNNKLVCLYNASDALKYLETASEKPFMILSDVNMPKMGGMELRNLIFKDEVLRSKTVPFVYLTTHAAPADVILAYQLSVQGFFKKPASFEELKELLSTIFNYWRKGIHPNNQPMN